MEQLFFENGEVGGSNHLFVIRVRYSANFGGGGGGGANHGIIKYCLLHAKTCIVKTLRNH